MLNIIQSFDEGIEASFRVRDIATDGFEIKNDLRQGFRMALTLFNLYFNVMVSTVYVA